MVYGVWSKPELSRGIHLKGRWYCWKPSSSSNLLFRVVSLIEIRRTVPCRSIWGNSVSVNRTLFPSYLWGLIKTWVEPRRPVSAAVMPALMQIERKQHNIFIWIKTHTQLMQIERGACSRGVLPPVELLATLPLGVLSPWAQRFLSSLGISLFVSRFEPHWEPQIHHFAPYWLLTVRLPHAVLTAKSRMGSCELWHRRVHFPAVPATSRVLSELSARDRSRA